jgi:hypothetical protein
MTTLRGQHKTILPESRRMAKFFEPGIPNNHRLIGRAPLIPRGLNQMDAPFMFPAGLLSEC